MNIVLKLPLFLHAILSLSSLVMSINSSHVPPLFRDTYARLTPHVRINPPKFYKYQSPIGSEFRANKCTDRKMETVDAGKLRSEFLQVLRSRRSEEEVLLPMEPSKPVANPLYQETPPPRFSEAMESCPKANITNFSELLIEENIYLRTEAGEQGRLPVLILSMKAEDHQRRPAIVFLHSTHKCKEWLRPLLEAYASRGYITVAIDSRYHGERARNLTTYRDHIGTFIMLWNMGCHRIQEYPLLLNSLTSGSIISHSAVDVPERRDTVSFIKHTEPNRWPQALLMRMWTSLRLMLAPYPP